MTITMERPANLQALYLRATQDAQKHKIRWEGDITQGHGKHRGFEARFEVTDTQLIIRIIKKPPFITEARIKREVQAYVNAAEASR